MKICIVIRQNRTSAARDIDSVWSEENSHLALKRTQMIDQEPSYKAWVEFHKIRKK